MTSPKKLGQWTTPGAWENVVDFIAAGEITVGHALNRAAMNACTPIMWDIRPDPPKPRRYHPSLMAHRPG